MAKVSEQWADLSEQRAYCFGTILLVLLFGFPKWWRHEYMCLQVVVRVAVSAMDHTAVHLLNLLRDVRAALEARLT